jgi:hypothetical protein
MSEHEPVSPMNHEPSGSGAFFAGLVAYNSAIPMIKRSKSSMGSFGIIARAVVI